MVDLNITLWIQLANFLVTLVVLNYLLISPIRKIIRKRKDNVEGSSTQELQFQMQAMS